MVIKDYLKYFAVLFVILVGSAASAGLATDENYTYLHAKNPRTWSYDLNGAWGKLAWKTAGKKAQFVFDGRKLKRKFNYTLVYYPDPIPGNGLICIGTAKSDRRGNIRIKGNVFGPLPRRFDKNFGKGAKIWLVSSADLNCQAHKFIKGNPESYLYGTRWINIR